VKKSTRSCENCASLNVCSYRESFEIQFNEFPFRDSEIDDEYIVEYTFDDVEESLYKMIGNFCIFFSGKLEVKV